MGNLCCPVPAGGVRCACARYSALCHNWHHDRAPEKESSEHVQEGGPNLRVCHAGRTDLECQYETTILPKLWIVAVEVGEDLLHACRDAVGQRMRNNQIKLLLRREPKLHTRVGKTRADGQRIRQILLEAAARYSVTTQPEQSPSAGRPEAI